jgi:hypothetical protein
MASANPEHAGKFNFAAVRLSFLEFKEEELRSILWFVLHCFVFVRRSCVLLQKLRVRWCSCGLG